LQKLKSSIYEDVPSVFIESLDEPRKA